MHAVAPLRLDMSGSTQRIADDAPDATTTAMTAEVTVTGQRISRGPNADTTQELTRDLGHVLEALVTAHPRPGWRVRLDRVWAHADQADHIDSQLPAQGWKLHVSATPASAESMLVACGAVLLEAGCTFKVARDTAQVRALTSAHCPKGNAGKVLTAYPATDAEAVRVAHLLDAVTDGLSGPRIPNDQVLRPGSVVHYRYGVFTGTPTLSHDGTLSLSLVDPDGSLVADVRGASFSPPPWVQDPFGRPVPPSISAQAASSGSPRQVLLGDRFAVHEAIRHGNRGGVFRATDRQTGAPVVIKQARAHVAADRLGRDVRDRLRHEAVVLQLLAASRVTPQPVAVFDQHGDLFLAEEDVAAPTLRVWATMTPRPIRDALTVLAHVARALEVIHTHGVVLRDLSPNNTLIRDDLTICVIDTELAVLPGAMDDLCPRSGTAAYAPQEQLAGTAPDPGMDLHALGALVLFTVTGEDPLVGADGSTSLTAWCHRGHRAAALPDGLLDLALRLCGPAALRPAAADVSVELLRIRDRSAATGWRPADETEQANAALRHLVPLDAATLETAIETLLDRLVGEVSGHGSRIAPASTFGEMTLPTNVQHGAAGLLGVLVQALRLRADERAGSAAGAVARWIEQTPVPTGGAVGLHFGHAGPAWALAEAAAALDDAALLRRSVERALVIPTDFPGPDITQGRAGLGLTLIRLWELTEDERLLGRIAALARGLADDAVHDVAGITWRTPRQARSSFAGKRFHGFAHGTAGIATFLSYAAALLDEDRLTRLAAESTTGLVRAAVTQPDGRLLWGSGPEESSPGIPHWCNGSSGVATGLVRSPEAAGLRHVLEGAARAIVAAKWQSGTAYCHGLSGNADALLDLADVTGLGACRSQAGDLLRIMWERRQVDARGPGLSDEPGRITPDFGVGYAGGLSTLMRYRHGGPRLWLPEGQR